MRHLHWTLVAALLAAACQSDADALVVVTVVAEAPIAGVASLHGTVSAKGKTAPVDVVDKTGAFFTERSSLTFALQIPAAYAGTIDVTMEARDADGNVLASGTATGTARAGAKTLLTIPFAAVVCDSDLGGCGDMANGCDPGFHPCAGTCVDSTATSSCGNSCDPCPSPPNSMDVACVSGACTFACASGFKKCGLQCVPSGDCCASDCPPVANGTPICDTNACSASCDSGFKLCSGACIPVSGCCVNADCAPVTNGTVTCSAGHTCSLSCNAGTVASNGMCDVAPPRLLWPVSESRVSSRQPNLKVVLAASTDDALIDVCDEPTCAAHAPVATFLASAGAPALQLPGRKTLFWRAHGKKNGVVGTVATGTWEFVTPATSATKNTAVTVYADVNKDGYADVIAGTPAAKQVLVYLGSASGAHTTPDATLKPPVAGTGFGTAVAVGDLDGDGFGEVIVATGGGSAQVFVWKGGPTLLVANQPPMATINGPASTGYGNTVAALGDYNGDGYGDFAVSAASSNAFYVYAGSANGIVNDQAALHTVAAPMGKTFGSIAGPGDVNCDGLGDVIVGGTDEIFLHLGASNANYTGAVTSTGGPAGSGFGLRLASAGDLNNDGCADVAVGESAFAATHQGFVALGGASGLGSATGIADPGGTTNFGVYAAGAGNIGGSDNGSLIVSSSASLYVYVGPPPMTLRSTITLTSAAGNPFGSAGDTNNDGYEDSFAVSGNTNVVMFHGSPSGFGTTVTSAAVSIPSPTGAGFGAVAMRVERTLVQLASLFLPSRRR